MFNKARDIKKIYDLLNRLNSKGSKVLKGRTEGRVQLDLIIYTTVLNQLKREGSSLKAEVNYSHHPLVLQPSDENPRYSFLINPFPSELEDRFQSMAEKAVYIKALGRVSFKINLKKGRLELYCGSEDVGQFIQPPWDSDSAFETIAGDIIPGWMSKPFVLSSYLDENNKHVPTNYSNHKRNCATHFTLKDEAGNVLLSCADNTPLTYPGL